MTRNPSPPLTPFIYWHSAGNPYTPDDLYCDGLVAGIRLDGSTGKWKVLLRETATTWPVVGYFSKRESAQRAAEVLAKWGGLPSA